MAGLTTDWVRRCARCRTVDLRVAWDDPARADSDAAVGGRRRWYQWRRARWTCPACGWHEYTVEPHESTRR